MPEEILYEAIKEGDIKAFEKLFEEFYPSMCMVAMKFVADRSVAEDIAQEAFVRLWEKRAEYDSILSLKTFLYVIVKNLSFNYLRNKKINVDYNSPEAMRQETFFHNRLIEEETYRVLTHAIESLAPQSAKIMKLTLEGKQNKEISELLQISVSTVKTLKYNALSTLKDNLEGYFYILLLILIQK